MSSSTSRFGPDGLPNAIAYDLHGAPIYKLAQLPKFLAFERVFVGQQSIAIDGWIFPYHLLCKKLLIWMRRSIHAWIKSHPEEKEWMNAVMETFQYRLAGDF